MVPWKLPTIQIESSENDFFTDMKSDKKKLLVCDRHDYSSLNSEYTLLLWVTSVTDWFWKIRVCLWHIVPDK